MRCFLLGLLLGCLGCCEPAKDLSPNLETLKKVLRESTDQIREAHENTSAEVTENSATLREIRQKIHELNDTVESKIPTPPVTVIAEPEVSPASTTSDDHTTLGVVAETSAGVPLYVSTIFGCGPCQRLKADEAAGMFNGFDVVYATDWEPRVYPAIRYQSKASSTGWAVIYGYSGQSTIDQLRKLTSEDSNYGFPVDPKSDTITSQSDSVRSFPHWFGFNRFRITSNRRPKTSITETQNRSYRMDIR